MQRRPAHGLLVASALVLMSATVLYQQETDGYSVPARFEVLRHLEWMRGESELYNPWQYRVLPDLAIEAAVRAFSLVPAWRARAEVVHRPKAPPQRRIAANGWALAPYFALRGLLGVAIFASFLAWLVRVGVEDAKLRWLGVVLLAYAMGQAHFDSGMAVSTYFDLWFYLLAALWITAGRVAWIPPLSLLAAFNRETGGLIPLMLATHAFEWPGPRLRDRRAAGLALASLLLFGVGFVAVRLLFGWRPPSPVYGNHGVVDFLRFNLTNRYTFPELLGSFGLIPVLSLLCWRCWTPELRRWFWLIVPAWLVLHLGFGLIRETRLLLVPYALLLLPGLLLCFVARPVAAARSGDPAAARPAGESLPC